MDFVALGSHCASLVRPRTALGPAPLAGSAPVRSRRREAPVRSCESVPRAGVGGPGSARAASTSLDPRDRRVTLENVCQGYVLAGQVTCSRVTRRSCGPDREAPPTKNRDQKAQGHPHEKGSMSFASSQYCAIIPPPPPSTFDCGVIRHRTVEGRRRAHISS